MIEIVHFCAGLVNLGCYIHILEVMFVWPVQVYIAVSCKRRDYVSRIMEVQPDFWSWIAEWSAGRSTRNQNQVFMLTMTTDDDTSAADARGG